MAAQSGKTGARRAGGVGRSRIIAKTASGAHLALSCRGGSMPNSAPFGLA